MKRFWDISRLLTDQVAPWPGDQPFRFQLNARIGKKSVVNIGALSMSVHNGTHADAPFHFSNDGRTIEAVALENYVGSAAVVDLAERCARDRSPIAVRDLQPAETDIKVARRLLIKTNCFLDSTKFPAWIPVLTLETIAWIERLGLLLLGMDVPSVDPIDAKQLSNHLALARGNIAILESLDLREVDAGVYHLAALPLSIAGADGAPVRAILWRDMA
jgi:arylformamidase